MLDREATNAEQGRALRHIRDCSGCAELWRTTQSVHRAVAERYHAHPRPRQSPEDVVRWVRRESGRRALTAGLRRIAVAASLLVLAWVGTLAVLRSPEPALPCDDILVHLDVLEDLEEQGIEPTTELLEILLEMASHESETQMEPSWVDLEIFDVLLEEEILPESL
jgi:hypothetical protein